MEDETGVGAWGRLFRAHRLRAGMSQEELARISGVSVRGIRMIENGRRRPRASTVKTLAESLRLSATDQRTLLEAAQPLARTEAAPTRGATVATATFVPRQLPPAIAGFVGRKAELKGLDNLLTADPVSTSVGVITGPAGVGKTTLAVHWAHHAAAQFPDGQIYIDLQGFSPAGKLTTPTEAVRAILDALGMAATRLPHSLTGQIGLYRSLVAGKRLLIVLDNARNAEQARPILPGGPECVTLVTSRDRLTGLIATEAASPVVLDVMTESEGHQLMAARIGPERTAAEPQAIAHIGALCSHLPLALAVIASRAALHPHIPLADSVIEIRSRERQLDALASGEPNTSLRTVFSWSYDQLTPRTARLFRLLALHPGPDLSIAAATALTGDPRPDVAAMLTELEHANLLVEDCAHRYHFHDLLHAYAFDLTMELDHDADRDAATRRLLDHYLHTTVTAERLLNPQRRLIELDPPFPGSLPSPLGDRAEALNWFTGEHRNLCAIIRRAADGHDRHTWQLAWAMNTYLGSGRWSDWIPMLETALAAAIRLGDQDAHNRIRHAVGNAHIRLGNADEARHHLTTALEQGHPRSQGNAHLALGFVAEQQGDLAEALTHADRALQLFRQVDELSGQAKALNAIGWYSARLGDFDRALRECHQAMALLRRLDDPFGEAETWDSIGFIHHHLSHLDEAVTSYQRALRLHTELGNTHQLAKVYLHLAETHQAMGTIPAARDDYREAISLLDKLGHPDAEPTRDRLRRL